MACSPITGGFRLGDCDFGIGGLEKIYIAQYSGSTTWGLDSDNQVTGVTACPVFYIFDLANETGSAEENIVNNQTNLTSYFEGRVELVIPKQTVATRNQVNSMAKSTAFVITKDKNGVIKLYGKTSGCNVSEGKINTGKAAGDANNNVLTFRSVEREGAYILSSLSISGLTTSY